MDTNSVDDNRSLSTNNGIGDEAEGIWSADIEQSFLEALAIYPPCGRRKIILTEEGKMYGRNELVARYIKIRTGKTRTRKQVSSHLQVLAKRRSKEIQSLRNDKAAQEVILDRLRRYTSAEIVSLNNEQITSDNESCSGDSGESKMPKITSPVKNLLQPVPIDEHVVKSGSTLPVKLDLIKSSQGSHLPSQTPVLKKHTVKKEVPVNKTNTPMAPIMNTSRPMVLPNSPIAYTRGTGRSRCSSNASSSSPLSSGSVNSQTVTMVNPLIYPLAVIGGEHFRLHDLSAVIEIKRTIGTTTHQSLIYPPAEIYSTEQHDLVRLHANDIRMKNIHAFETISIDQIFDKFPRNDGLKDLFERNPDGSFYLIKFWADVPIPPPITSALNIRDESFFTSFAYSSSTNRPIHISTRLCSFGKQVLEKVDMSENPQLDPFQQFVHRFDRTPLCEYMVQFIQKLRSLPNAYMMNSVLENFTVLQVIKCLDNSERLLLCLAFVFEIAMPDVGGPQYQVYKLVSNLK